MAQYDKINVAKEIVFRHTPEETMDYVISLITKAKGSISDESSEKLPASVGRAYRDLEQALEFIKAYTDQFIRPKKS